MLNNNFSNSIAIVLTGTIIPNTTHQLQHLDPQIRRSEYLAAISFYNKLAPVYFLENSSYPLLEDEEFTNLPNTFIRKFPISNFPEKGRGFQEFEMLDAWMQSESNAPKQWLKITGRYIYENVQDILNECTGNSLVEIIINQYRFSGYVDPAIFCISSVFYQNNISKLYHECDDQHGWFIEKVLYKLLQPVEYRICQRFKNSLICSGIAGFSGQKIQGDWRSYINRQISPINYLFDRKYIWLSM
jgi:hypothetical protein